MAKNTTADWDTTAANNTDVGGINIDENCAAANVNNAMREIMAQIAGGLSGMSVTPSNKTGLDTNIVTGTAGTEDYIVKWNADGDAVDGYAFLDEDDMASDSASGVASQQSVKAFVESHLPAGAVSAFAMNTAPSGWLECDGSAVSRTTYADLFAAIGTTWGSGDGSTTFNLPDLRGEFIRGWDNGRGVDSGRSFASSQSDQFKAHTHTISKGLNGGGAHVQTGPDAGGTMSTDSTGGSETRPRNIALMYCIRT